MFCPNCGKQIPENVKFCNHCGAAQANAPAQSTRQRTQLHAEQGPQQQQSYQQTDEKALKKYLAPYVSRNIFIVMCAITIFFLFAGPIIAGFYAAFAAGFGIAWAYGCNQMNKRISSAKADGTYEKVLQEFGTSTLILGGKARYSGHYIFGKGSGRFFKYEDIYWVYRHIVRYFLIPFSSTAMVGIHTGELFSLCGLKLGNKSGADQIKELAAIIYSKNPNVILGFNAEKEKEFKKKTK